MFDTVTTGAANDIERATDIARNMVTRYGMSKRFGLVGLATVESQYLEGRTELNCSDTTAAEIDQEVVEILKESYEKALSMLEENRDVMDKLAEFLIEKETITGKEFMEIFRKEKGLPEPEEKEPEGENRKTETQKAKNPETEHSEAEHSEAGNPEADNPKAEKPEAGKPETMDSEAGTTETGNPKAEKPEAERSETGNPKAENPGTADESGEDKKAGQKVVGRFSNRELDQ